MDFTNKIKSILLELGLTSVQSDFYLLILRGGGTTVSRSAKTLGINRTNAYAILEKLKSLNLVWEEEIAGGKVVYAKSYEVLLEKLDQKEQEVLDFKDEIKQLVPMFNSFSSKNQKRIPKIKIFTGEEGLQNTEDEILGSLKKGDEILLFSNQESEQKFFSKRKHGDFIKRRISTGINIRVLAIENEKGRELKIKDKESLRETRFLPQSFDFSAETYIFLNKVVMIDLAEEIVGVVVESDELNKIQRQLFENLWK